MKERLLVGPAREKWLSKMRRCVLLDFVAGATIRQIANRQEVEYAWVEQVIRDVVQRAKKEGQWNTRTR